MTGAYYNKTAAIIIAVILLLSVGIMPALAQALTTPTANPDGDILYTVIENDTCLALEMRTDATIAEIIALNNLDENCTLTVGTQILLGHYDPPTATPGPSPTPTQTLEATEALAGNAQVCVYLFEDTNGNGIAEETEYGIGGGAVSVSKRDGSENFTGLTDGINLVCFETVPEGDYNISVAPPTEFNPTTNMNYPLEVKAGDTAQVNFGAQHQAAFEDPSEINSNVSTRSPLMAVVGILMIVAGVAIAVIFGVVKRRDY